MSPVRHVPVCSCPGRCRRAATASGNEHDLVFQQTDTLPLQAVIGGDYLDHVEKVDGEWRFTERHMANNLVGNLKAHGRDAGVIRVHRAN